MMAALPISAVAVLLLQAPVVSAQAGDASMDQNERQVYDSAYKWRFTMPYYDQKKQSFVCETAVTSGDKRSDRVFCRAMVSCYNRYKTEHSRMMRATGDAVEIPARDFRQKRNNCFRSEVAPLITELAAQRSNNAR